MRYDCVLYLWLSVLRLLIGWTICCGLWGPLNPPSLSNPFTNPSFTCLHVSRVSFECQTQVGLVGADLPGMGCLTEDEFFLMFLSRQATLAVLWSRLRSCSTLWQFSPLKIIYLLCHTFGIYVKPFEFGCNEYLSLSVKALYRSRISYFEFLFHIWKCRTVFILPWLWIQQVNGLVFFTYANTWPNYKLTSKNIYILIYWVEIIYLEVVQTLLGWSCRNTALGSDLDWYISQEHSTFLRQWVHS